MLVVDVPECRQIDDATDVGHLEEQHWTPPRDERAANQLGRLARVRCVLECVCTTERVRALSRPPPKTTVGRAAVCALCDYWGKSRVWKMCSSVCLQQRKSAPSSPCWGA